jgi:hypothetical protein
VRLIGPSRTGLFLYDNHTFIVENFAAPGGDTVTISAVTGNRCKQLVDVVSGDRIPGRASGNEMVFDLALPPASYRVFSAE